MMLSTILAPSMTTESEDFTSFLKADAQKKRRLPIDLQRLWRLDRGLCPLHGQPLSLATWDMLARRIDRERELTPLECPVVGCGAKVSAWDWNIPGNEDRPYCIESLG